MFSISPAEVLNFDLSPGGSKSQQILLTNTASHRIAYKVRTTASKSYLVKPSQGYLSPKESISISVMLQGSDVQQDSKHKFLILATNSVHCEDFALWNHIAKDKVYEVKLDVSFGAVKSVQQDAPRRLSIYSDTKNSVVESLSTDEISANIKKLEAEKIQLESRLNQINLEIRMKENKPRKGEGVKFKQNTLLMFVAGGLIFGFMYA